MPHRWDLLIVYMVEDQLQPTKVNVIHQPYIVPIHQSIQSKLFSKLNITFAVKLDNNSNHDQLTYIRSVSAKPINYRSMGN